MEKKMEKIWQTVRTRNPHSGQKCWKRKGKWDGKVDHSREKWKRLGKKRKSWVCRCKNWHLTTDNWKINQPIWLSPTKTLNLVIQPPNVQVSLNWCTEIACLKSPYLGYQKSSKIGATISPRWKYILFSKIAGVPVRMDVYLNVTIWLFNIAMENCP